MSVKQPSLPRPPLIGDYLTEDMPHAKFLENGRRYRVDVEQWLRDNNHLMRGRQALTRFSKAHDDLLIAALGWTRHEWGKKNTGKAPKLALVALGGYGRRELFLRSDIDIMVLMEDNQPSAQSLVTILMHLLIDLRLNLGYSTRTIEDCLGRVGEDLESTTAMAEARLLSGSKGLFERFALQLRNSVGSKGKRWFLRAVYEVWQQRHEEKNSIYQLQPDLKDGPGGLRDVHTVMWMLYAMTGSSDLRDLTHVAEFDEADLERYRESIAFLESVRNELHIVSGNKHNHLLFDYQPAIAQRFGYQDKNHRTAAELFMADYYRHAQAVMRYSARAIKTIIATQSNLLEGLVKSLQRRRLEDGFVVQNDTLYIPAEQLENFLSHPQRIMEMFERAQRWGYRISSRIIDKIRLSIIEHPQDLQSDPVILQSFLRMLRGPWNVGRILSEMHACGFLELILPEFEAVRCMVRIDQYHQYTVDEHTFRALNNAELLRREPPGQPSFEGSIALQIESWSLLNLSLLLHDLGKGFGRAHALRGGQLAQRIGERLGLKPQQIEMVRFLVLSHLKLTQVALRRDVSDPQVAHQLAEEIGSPELLRMLFIHSVCDLQAVGPGVWNDWKALMLRECFVRTAQALGEEISLKSSGPKHAGRLRGKVLDQLNKELKAQKTPSPGRQEWEAQIQHFLGHVSEQYLMAMSPVSIARHILLRTQLTSDNLIAWQLYPASELSADYSELVVCASDVTGLFSYLCGAMAARGLNIWQARIFSTTDGLAINQFMLTDHEGKPLSDGMHLERLRADLNRVLKGELEFAAIVEKHTSRYSRRTQIHAPQPPSVQWDNTSSNQYTIIEIKATDRPGLLYQITRTLNELELNIQRSIINTEAYGVMDVFYVTDLEYNKIYNEKEQAKIAQALLENLAADKVEDLFKK